MNENDSYPPVEQKRPGFMNESALQRDAEAGDMAPEAPDAPEETAGQQGPLPNNEPQADRPDSHTQEDISTSPSDLAAMSEGPAAASASPSDTPEHADLEPGVTPENEQPAESGSQPQEEEGVGGQNEQDGEAQPRRVVLQAGTDEESLKALALCREKVAQLHLRMHPLAARWETDRHVIIFFRAEEKVDFRKLVRELSRILHARIELRQVGPREQGKLCGLVGKCGYSLCCQTFLGQFAQSTIKMAKTQELALNPMKISGICGRLLCCLNYEQDMYLDAKSRLPRVNRMVETEYGPGRVVAVNVLKETVTVQLETTTKELRPDQIRVSEPQA